MSKRKNISTTSQHGYTIQNDNDIDKIPTTEELIKHVTKSGVVIEKFHVNKDIGVNSFQTMSKLTGNISSSVFPLHTDNITVKGALIPSEVGKSCLQSTVCDSNNFFTASPEQNTMVIGQVNNATFLPVNPVIQDLKHGNSPNKLILRIVRTFAG